MLSRKRAMFLLEAALQRISSVVDGSSNGVAVAGDGCFDTLLMLCMMWSGFKNLCELLEDTSLHLIKVEACRIQRKAAAVGV